MLQTVDVVVSLAEEEAETAAVASATTAACGSSFCSSAAAALEMAADAAALTADANLISERGRSITLRPFYCNTTSVSSMIIVDKPKYKFI